MQTKHSPVSVRLIPDTQKMSRMSQNTLNSFRDQQKYKVKFTDIHKHLNTSLFSHEIKSPDQQKNLQKIFMPWDKNSKKKVVREF